MGCRRRERFSWSWFLRGQGAKVGSRRRGRVGELRLRGGTGSRRRRGLTALVAMAGRDVQDLHLDDVRFV